MRDLVKWGITICGVMLLLIGAVFTPLPPPFFGIPLLIIGTALVVAGSKTARRLIQGVRHKYPKIFSYLDQVEHKFPKQARYYIRKTHPKPLVRKARAAAERRKRKHGKNSPSGATPTQSG